MSKSVKIEKERVLLDDVFKVEEAYLRHELPGGGMSDTVRRLNFERGDSAAALVVNRDRRTCVMAEQFRYPAHKRGEGWLMEVPAGIVAEDETAEVSIRREILEEIGYRAAELTRIAAFFPSPGASSEKIDLFCAIVGDADRVSRGGGLETEHEVIEVLEMPLVEIEQYLGTQRVFDGKTLVALSWLQLRIDRGELFAEDDDD